MTKLYYTPPTDEQFSELKEKAIKVWFEMDSDQSYLEIKVGQLNRLSNVGDNFMYMVAMFDIHNQRKLAEKLSDETRGAVAERIKDGGSSDYYNVFI